MTLYSSYDGGQIGDLAQAFGNTGDKSTGHGQLVGDSLSLAYGTLDGNVMFAQLGYDSVARIWSVLGSETAFTSTQWWGQNPTLAVDELGTVWCAFLSTSSVNSKNSNLRVVNRVGGGNL